MEITMYKYLILIIYFYVFFRPIILNIVLVLTYCFIIVMLILPRKIQLKVTGYNKIKIYNSAFFIGKTLRKIQKLIPKTIKLPHIKLLDSFERLFYGIYSAAHIGYMKGISFGFNQNNASKEKQSDSFLLSLFLFIVLHVVFFLPSIGGIVLIFILKIYY